MRRGRRGDGENEVIRRGVPVPRRREKREREGRGKENGRGGGAGGSEIVVGTSRAGQRRRSLRHSQRRGGIREPILRSSFPVLMRSRRNG